ncbi:MAG TPA: organic solvent tolerance protein OstA, partial [Lacipirellulaceae bacterium]|nr:organic solvent tolerance protein OstA [Lacipirellulaceae bacterium]
STNLERPTYYLDNFRVRHDSIFGYQALFELSAFQLLGLDPVPGVKWDLNLDYLSQRGLGYGTGVEYARDGFFGLNGPTSGRLDAWFISDHGVDNLGRDRRNIDPEASFRGRVFWNDRQHIVGGLLDGWTLQGEAGWLSDRTFLEEYYEDEWDNNPDQLTGVRLKRTYDNQSLSIEANARINDFFTQTQWLPRLDHYWLGEPLLGDNLTWYEHTSLAYADIGIASTPTNPTLASQFELFPWEEDSAGNPIMGQGERLITRQEIDWPINAAPWKIVPFALGELGDWGEDINGDRFQRAYGETGLRASIPFWYADPNIHDALFNLNGLAHKVVFDVQASVAGANQPLTRMPLYEELDDDSIEDFSRRLFFSPFGGPQFGGTLAGVYYIPGAPSFIDPKFDPRFYALRYGLGDWVTSPSDEIADDLTAVRFGMHHRLQTKRGAPGEERIIDWVTLDANATYFPDFNRDNAGVPMGQMDYDFRWHLGDRFSILSDGYADTFGDGLRTASIGALLNRPSTGNVYIGFRAVGGPFEADVLTTNFNYRVTPKYIASVTSAVDFGPTGNIGQSLSFTRIGESLIATIGGNVDVSKGSVGVHFLVEPRFLPNLRTTAKTGIDIPPPGAYGLE